MDTSLNGHLGDYKYQRGYHSDHTPSTSFRRSLDSATETPGLTDNALLEIQRKIDHIRNGSSSSHASSTIPLSVRPRRTEQLLDSLKGQWTKDEKMGSRDDLMFLRSSLIDSPRSPVKVETSRSPMKVETSRSPMKVNHDIKSFKPISHDGDNGISNPLSSSLRFQRCGSPVVTGMDDGSSHSVERSPSRPYSRPFTPTMDSAFHHVVPNRSPSRASSVGDRSVHEMQCALGDSEDRRQILVEKLKGAKDTIQLQSQRLNDVEMSSKERSFETDGLRYKEREYQKKITSLERERQMYQDKTLEGLRIREDMQTKLEQLVLEMTALKTSHSLLQAECQRKDDVITQANKALTAMQDDGDNIMKGKECLGKEVTALKESLLLTRTRGEHLEDQLNTNKADLERLRQENHQYQRESKEQSRQQMELKSSNLLLKQENQGQASSMRALREEKEKMLKQLESINLSVAETSAGMATANAEKERYYHEKMEQHQRLQGLILDMDNINKVNSTLEGQVQELSTELAQSRLTADKASTDRRTLEEHFNTNKKMTEVLSAELSNTKARLEKAVEQTQSLEHARKVANQQHDMYGQEIRGLEEQNGSLRKSLSTLKKEHMTDRTAMDEQGIKLKEEMRSLKTERNQFELSCHELEAKVKQCEQNLREHSETQQKDVEMWRENCERLTGSVSRKELEIQGLNKQLGDLQEELGYLKANHDTYHTQYEELGEAREEVIKIREENKRLLQERAENQQLIQLLEMQKNILTKSSEGSLTKAQDMTQLQFKVDEVTTENERLRKKISELEQGRNELIEEKEKKLASGDYPGGLGDRAREMSAVVQELEKHNKQLRDVNELTTEQLTKLEQENLRMKAEAAESVSRGEHRRLEQERSILEENYTHLKDQFDKLEHRHQKLLADRPAAESLSATGDVMSVQHENGVLDGEVSMLRGQLSLLENSKKRAEDQVLSLQRQLENVTQQVFTSGQRDQTEVMTLKRKVNELQNEVQDSKQARVKQDTLIHSLKERSLDDVSKELTQMRAELQKLLEVIQVKDQEIDDLDQQLKMSKEHINSRDKMIGDLKSSNNFALGNGSSSSSGHLVNGKLSSWEEEKIDMAESIKYLEREKSEIKEEVCALAEERDLAVKDADDLRHAVDDLQKMYDEERAKLMDKMRKELCAKDRQIESLEEQLQRATNHEIKKLKRDASKVELLKAENRRLAWQVSPFHSSPITAAIKDTTTFTCPQENEDERHGNTSVENGQQNTVEDEELSWDNSDEDQLAKHHTNGIDGEDTRKSQTNKSIDFGSGERGALPHGDTEWSSSAPRVRSFSGSIMRSQNRDSGNEERSKVQGDGKLTSKKDDSAMSALDFGRSLRLSEPSLTRSRFTSDSRKGYSS